MSTHTTFITTTIPYVNSSPHVGFALELVQADTYVRYQRLKGRSIAFQSGTDENSLKNVIAARERNVPVQYHVDHHAAQFKHLASVLSISFDHFIRTTSEVHRSAVHRFWSRLKPTDLYRKRYGGHYCVGCEDFLQEDDLSDGLCRDHAAAPEWIEEENVFFRLSQYQETLSKLIEDDQIRITPSYRKSEILNFISGGLNDISVSRDRVRSGGWGIPLPGDDSQVIYVWIDALINYVSGISQASSDLNAWNSLERKVHFIGKNVWKFHAIYWPALLLSAGLCVPDEIVIHGFLTLDGKKISKSVGNVVDPIKTVEEFGADSLRFYLLRSFSPFDDGDFSIQGLKESHNSYLANGLGNLLSRLTALAGKLNLDSSELELRSTSIHEFDAALDFFRFDEGLKVLWRGIDRINSEIATLKPWEKLATETKICRSEIVRWLEELWNLGLWVGVFLPTTGLRIDQQIRSLGEKKEHLFKKLEDR